MLIKKEDAKEKMNTDSCTVWDYDIPSTTISFVTAKINGRYPEKGSGCNTESDMVYFVISGSGTVFLGDNRHEISEGDAIYFPRGLPYYVEGDNLHIAIPNAPPFDVGQYKITTDINEE